MGFINNKNNTLSAYQLNVMTIQPVCFILYVAHFLNGSNNQSISGIIAFELTDKHIRIFCRLHILIFISKSPIFFKRLGSKLNSVH